MTKEELVKTIAKKADVNQHVAQRCLNAFLETVKEAVKNGKQVRIVGFGKFAQVERKARIGKNPKTGEKIKIPAKKVVRFYPGKELQID